MVRYLLIVNRYKDKDNKISFELKKQIETILYPCVVDIIFDVKDYVNIGYNLIFTVGGDGTILQASHIANNIPIVGINLGRVGFMAAIEIDKIIEYLYRIKEGNYSVKTYSFLESNIDGNKHKATNDIVIGKFNMLKTISLSLCINAVFVENYICDGLLISSAFGSTAYNMSLNGPIVHPDSPVIIITPIAPIGLKTSSLIIPDNNIISITVHSHSEDEYEGLVGFDGSNDSIKIKGDKTIEIVKGFDKFSLLEFDNYYNNLRNKLYKTRSV